jgi:hypothetical protein
VRWWPLVLCACGRIAFDPRDGGGPSDTTDGAQLVTTCSAHTGAIFCEDFETDLSRWEAPAGTTAIQSTVAHSGTNALGSTTGPGPDMAYLQYDLPATIATGSLHVRYWVYVPSTTDPQHVELVDANGFSEGMVSMVYKTDMSLYTGITATNLFQGPGPSLTKDQWFCVEFAIQIADTGGSFELRVNDQVVLTPSGLDTLPSVGTSGYTRIKAGIPYVANDQPTAATVYTDDIVVDTAHIGCAP